MEHLTTSNLKSRKAGSFRERARRFSESLSPEREFNRMNSSLGRFNFPTSPRRSSLHRQLSLRLSRNRVSVLLVCYSFLSAWFFISITCAGYFRNPDRTMKICIIYSFIHRLSILSYDFVYEMLIECLYAFGSRTKVNIPRKQCCLTQSELLEPLLVVDVCFLDSLAF